MENLTDISIILFFCALCMVLLSTKMKFTNKAMFKLQIYKFDLTKLFGHLFSLIILLIYLKIIFTEKIDSTYALIFTILLFLLTAKKLNG